MLGPHRSAMCFMINHTCALLRLKEKQLGSSGWRNGFARTLQVPGSRLGRYSTLSTELF